MVLRPEDPDYDKCVKAFQDEYDTNFKYRDESYFFVRSSVVADNDYLITGVWQNSFSVFTEDIDIILKRLEAVITLDDDIRQVVVDGYKLLVSKCDQNRCSSFFCCDDSKYCHLDLRVNSSTLGFGFHLTAYCTDK